MHIAIKVDIDVGQVGANWMVISLPNREIDRLKTLISLMNTEKVLSGVDQIVLDCDINVVHDWPFKMEPPTSGLYVSDVEPEYSMSYVELNLTRISTDCERVSISPDGRVEFISVYKHYYSYGGVITSICIDIKDIS
jgi:hypothetical protein